MKKSVLHFLLVAFVFVGCSKYDDSDLRNKVDNLEKRVTTLEDLVNNMNSDISSVQSLLTAMNRNQMISGVVATATGWEITLSNGEKITIREGANAAVVTVVEIDGKYWWATITNGGSPVPVAPVIADVPVTPVIGVNANGYLTVDYGNGPEVIQGPHGPVIADLEANYNMITGITQTQFLVTFTFADGTSFSIPKAQAVSISIDAVNGEYFQWGEIRTFKVRVKGASNVTVTAAPSTWVVWMNGDNTELSVMAPATAAPPFAIATITLNAYGDGVATAQFTTKADTYVMKYLTFEGSYWNSLIDNKQYNGSLLYYPNVSTSTAYGWSDASNTKLASEIIPVYYSLYDSWSYNFFAGGEAISNYVERRVDEGTYLTQLSVYYQHENGYGGRFGSKNFCVHYGYTDSYPYTGDKLQNIHFSDNVARVIDHMYVTSTTYFYNSVLNGDSFVGKLAGYVDIEAIAYNGATQTGKTTFRIANGQNDIKTSWTKWDLSVLGAVTKIEFNVTGSSDNFNAYGLARPAYFAYDDVAVRF